MYALNYATKDIIEGVSMVSIFPLISSLKIYMWQPRHSTMHPLTRKEQLV